MIFHTFQNGTCGCWDEDLTDLDSLDSSRQGGSNAKSHPTPHQHKPALLLTLGYIHYPLPITSISAPQIETVCFSEKLCLPVSLHGAKSQNIVVFSAVRTSSLTPLCNVERGGNMIMHSEWICSGRRHHVLRKYPIPIFIRTDRGDPRQP
jgi:hypothetical protein